MDNNNRPHSREKHVSSGSAHLEKGGRVETGGRPVGGSDGRGSTRPQQSQRTGSSYSAPQRSSGGLLGILLALPKGIRRILLLVVAFVIISSLLRTCSKSGSLDYDDYGYESQQQSAQQQTAQPSVTLPSETGLSGLNTATLFDADPLQIEQQNTGAGEQPDLTISGSARAKRVIPKGNGQDVVTIMVYMCGTDLESKYGMATSDLQEMIKANISDKVNLIVTTGGCSRWKNNVISNKVNEIYKVETGGLRRLESDFGTRAMTDPDNLTNFINYCQKNYPANRNILIFWDHGGGSLSGYGYDEKNKSAGSMPLTKINSALKNAGCTFDWIGFDACLMATLETCLVCNEYADYMIASEESEPGTGWYYTSWLNALSKNTSISTVELSKVLIDGFVDASCAAAPSAKVTLSVVDLAELSGTVPDAFRDFSTSTTQLLQSSSYQQVSNARAGVRQFAASNRINQVDLIDLAKRINTAESNALAKALSGCVKYNNSTISRAYGVSIYFPYESLSSMNSAIAAYQDLGIDTEYTKCIRSFASLAQGGQIAAASSQPSLFGTASGGGDLLSALLSSYAGGATASPVESLFGGYTSSSGAPSAGTSLDAASVMDLLSMFAGRSMPQGMEWVDTDLVAGSARTISQNYIDPGRISISYNGGRRVLSLTEEEWSLIQTVELNVFADDGEGFIDLGRDNVFEWLGDDLLLDYDGTWMTVNGTPCAYYLLSDDDNGDGTWTTTGRIPALLNGEAVNLLAVFSSDAPAGQIVGAYPLYEDAQILTQAKGNIPVMPGDTIQFLCDYYAYDGTYDSSYTLGTPITVGSYGLTLSNMALDATGYSVCYRLTDIYGNQYWTPAWQQ